MRKENGGWWLVVGIRNIVYDGLNLKIFWIFFREFVRVKKILRVYLV